MATYDIPGVGSVSVTIDTHQFGNSDTVLRSLGEAVDSSGNKLPFAQWEQVNAHLRNLGVVN